LKSTEMLILDVEPSHICFKLAPEDNLLFCASVVETTKAAKQ